MLRRVLAYWDHFEIVEPVVCLVVILVVDMIFRGQATTEVLFHEPPAVHQLSFRAVVLDDNHVPPTDASTGRVDVRTTHLHARSLPLARIPIPPHLRDL